MRRTLFERSKTAGLTLIEAMIVVAIIGILASFASTAYEYYIVQSKNSEVPQMFSSITNGEIKFFLTPRNFNGVTLNPCFLAAVRTPLMPGSAKMPWVDSYGSFKTLDIHVASSVYYSYQVTAAGNVPAVERGFCTDETLQSLPVNGATGPFATISAIGDVDGDGNLDVLGALSQSVYAQTQVTSCSAWDPARAPGVFNKPCGTFKSMFVMSLGVDANGNPTKSTTSISVTMP